MLKFICFLYFILIVFASQNMAYASSTQSVLEEFYDDIDIYIATLLFYEWLDYDSNALRNPKNIIDLYDNKTEYQLRPDLRYQYNSLQGVFKPRLSIESTYWENSLQQRSSESEIDLYVNEWLIDYNFYESFYLAGGRENLQWGPAFFLSPSNPFFDDKGLSNPKREIGGQDFVKLNWYPNFNWSLSLLANIGQGRYEPVWDHSDFEPTYALKIDYITYRKFISLIGSYKNNDRARLGSYAGWNVTDSILFYAELGLSAGNDVLYPETGDKTVQYTAKNDDYDQITSLSTLGVSYTFETGSNISLEYLYNSAGYNSEEAELYFDTFEKLHCLLSCPYNPGGIPPGISASNVKKALYPELQLLRRNYIFAQYRKLDILDNLDLILRFTYNIDDQSANVVPVINYGVGDHVELFFIALQTFGAEDAELSSLVNTHCTFGIQMIF